ncbi:thiamine pyrophosphate-dependent enzyme [Salinimonas sediminis]|uniref:Ubiquinone-dependent pyruvate dehydrogenase n=1 Tax=Salinimonas sediminis TaxID=2303538 RepID=A0A346NN08_9ALTE|nr:thiamine pyrophosphate-dependent enzyme [Salinimonas sediminis]AXR06915.1 ubiquinone-dependent pyruvate dehydrogenase [Salinimonas sediminis]
MTQTVSHIITDALIQAGAKHCYGIVGDTINHFTNAISQSSLKWISVRHEEVAGFAAGAEAYMTQQLAVCAGACGPGSLHFINGIYESHRNGAPVVFIATNVDRNEEGFQFPQEVDQKKIYEQYSVFCERVSHPSQARRVVTMAAQAALAKGGVSVVVVNGDVFKEKVDDSLAWRTTISRPVVVPEKDDVEALAKLINEHEKITVYAGIGARRAPHHLIELAQKIKAPLVHTTKAKEFFEADNPCNAGMTGILGNKAGMQAMNEAQLVLCFGTDFAYTQFWPERAIIVQIDTNPANLGKRAPITMGLVGDAADTAEILLPLVSEKTTTRHLNAALTQFDDDHKGYAESGESTENLIHPQTLAQRIDHFAQEDAIFTADGGSPMVWMLRHIRANGQRRFLSSLSHGTMANAYPQALGIANAFPQKQVIALCGDGGMTMLMGDLLTLVQHKLPVKLVIFNNSSLGFVEMEQRVEGMLDAYTELKNPDFSAVAQACGLKGWKVDKLSQLDSAIEQWLASDGPAILDVAVNRMELVMPPEIEFNQVASTAMFGMKAVLNGRTDEVVSLIKDNFIR